MLAIIETIALLILGVWVGCFAFWGALQLIDRLFKTASYIIVKIFIDRSAAYDTFNICWDDVKKNN